MVKNLCARSLASLCFGQRRRVETLAEAHFASLTIVEARVRAGVRAGAGVGSGSGFGARSQKRSSTSRWLQLTNLMASVPEKFHPFWPSGRFISNNARVLAHLRAHTPSVLLAADNICNTLLAGPVRGRAPLLWAAFAGPRYESRE